MANKKKILIVEDEVIIAKGISVALNAIGYKDLTLAFTGPSALEKLEEMTPDLILMDIMLGGDKDGIEISTEIKEKYGEHMPIVYLTAYADQKTVARAKATNPVGYLLKPFHRRDMQALLERAFKMAA